MTAAFLPFEQFMSQAAQSNCNDCCDVDVPGGFLTFGDGDADGQCSTCHRSLMGSFADLRAFRTRFKGGLSSASASATNRKGVSASQFTLAEPLATGILASNRDLAWSPCDSADDIGDDGSDRDLDIADDD